MLADVVTRGGALIAGGGYVLLVFGPGDPLGVQEVDDGGYVGGEGVLVVILEAEGVTTDGSDVVRLRRVGY